MILSFLKRTKEHILDLYKRLISCSVYKKIFLGLSLFTLISITVFTFTSANWYFNSDEATANLLAEAIVREGSLFPEGWTYGQDIWVFFLHQPIALFTLFSDNYLAMHSFAAMVFIAMALASCIYFSIKLLKSHAWVVAVPLLFCGISFEYSYMVFGQCAYLPQVIFLFLTPALFTEAFDQNLKIKSMPKVVLLALWLAFLTMSGIRNIQSVCIPLIGGMLLVYFIDNHDNKLRTLWPSIKNLIIKCCIVGVPMLVGFGLFFLLVFNTNYSIGVLGGLSIANNNDFFGKLATLVSFALNVFNIQSGVALVSIQGITSLIGVLCLIFVGILFPILQYRKYKEESYEVKLFLMFSAVHIAEIIVIFLFTSLYATPRYLLSVQVLLFFISAHYIYKYILPKINILRTLVVVILLISFTLPQSTMHLINATKNDEMMESKLELVEFLESNGLTHGYATYWHAYNNTVLSNGKVEINGILYADNSVKPYYWLNDMKRYTEEAHSGSTFMLIPADEKATFEASTSYVAMGIPIKVLQHNDFTIYVYDYNVGANSFNGKTA